MSYDLYVTAPTVTDPLTHMDSQALLPATAEARRIASQISGHFDPSKGEDVPDASAAPGPPESPDVVVIGSLRAAPAEPSPEVVAFRLSTGRMTTTSEY